MLFKLPIIFVAVKANSKQSDPQPYSTATIRSPAHSAANTSYDASSPYDADPKHASMSPVREEQVEMTMMASPPPTE